MMADEENSLLSWALVDGQERNEAISVSDDEEEESIDTSNCSSNSGEEEDSTASYDEEGILSRLERNDSDLNECILDNEEEHFPNNQSEWITLGRMLGQNTHITKLAVLNTMDGEAITSGDELQLYAGLMSNRSIRDLSFTGPLPMLPNHFLRPWNTFWKYNNLSKLQLNAIGICRHDLMSLSKIIERQRCLVYIGVSNCLSLDGDCSLGQDDDLFECFVNEIVEKNMIPLNELDLLGNSIGSTGMTKLARAIQNYHPNLRVLTLQDTNIGCLSCSALASLLRSPNSRLSALDLWRCSMNDDCAFQLAGALKNNISLRTLNVTDNNFTLVGWGAFSTLVCDTASIADTFSSNHTLECLGTCGDTSSIPVECALNRISRDKRIVGIHKVIQFHPDKVLLIDVKLLPSVLRSIRNLSLMFHIVRNIHALFQYAIPSENQDSNVSNIIDRLEKVSISSLTKQGRGVDNLKDDEVQDTSDLAPTQEGGRGGTSSDAIEDDNSWGGDGQNKYDCGDDNGDIHSERELQSHIVLEEIITTAGAKDTEKKSEIRALTAEKKGAKDLKVQDTSSVAPTQEGEHLSEGRSQTEDAFEGNVAAELSTHSTANGVGRDVLWEQEKEQTTHAGLKRINSNSDGDDESKVGGGNNDEASGILSGDEQHERSQQDSVDGIGAETAHCDDNWYGDNHQDVFSPEKEDHEVLSEEARNSRVFGHHEGMAFSERGEPGKTPKVGDINLPEEVELHQGSALESERTVYVSKDDAEHYKLQIQQMKERNSALEEAAKVRETIESELRSKLAEQVKTAANLKAQLDQVTGEKKELEEQRLKDGELWDEERKRVEAQHATELQEMTAAESCVKSTPEELARSAELLQDKHDEVSQLKSEVEDMKGRHDDALAKVVAEKNRLKMELDSLRAQKQNESGSEAKGNLNSSSRYPLRHGRGSHLHLDGAASARSYETRSQSQRSGGGSTSTATAHTSPKPRLASRSRNNKSNPRSSLETIREGGGAFVAESRRTTASESKKGKAVSAKLRAELLNVLASTNDIPVVSLDDIIGQEKAKAAMLGLKPFRDPEYACLYEGIEEDFNSNTGILLYGPAGTGKTMFAKAMASNGGCIFIKISPDDILNEYIGKSEERMRGVFLVAKEKAVETGKTAVLFIDGCDRLFRKPRNNDCEVTSNITGIFEECMNGITEPKGQLIVLCTTNYKEKLPSSILSRFAIKIPINLPGRKERIAIAKRNIKSGHTLTGDDFEQFADMTDGYSGRDIFYLITKGAEPSRIVEAKEHNDAWCKNEEDCYVPCFHSPAHPCRAKESGSFREVKERTKSERIRPRPLALKHIKMGIDLLGEQEEMLDE